MTHELIYHLACLPMMHDFVIYYFNSDAMYVCKTCLKVSKL